MNDKNIAPKTPSLQAQEDWEPEQFIDFFFFLPS